VSAISATSPRVRALLLSPRWALVGIVAAGTVLHTLLGRLVVTPSVFPDEYLYSQLGRSLATTGHLKVRGVSAHFLPVLEPILTAPVWFAHDVETSFRLLQLENAFFMSLAAVPVYLIARRLHIGVGLALGLSVLAVSGPPALFAGLFLSEPLAYPLALAVVAATLAALDRPSLRAQLVLLAFVGLACFDRLQLAALPLCIAVVVVVVGLREHRIVQALREQWLLVGVTAVVALGGVTVALVHGLGYYKLHPHATSALQAVRLGGVSLYVLVFAVGAAIVPSAVVGLALAIVKPRTRGELAFGVLTVSFLVVTIVQCVVWGDVTRVQERYLGYTLPLLGIAFGLRVTRTERRRIPELGVASAIAAVAALVPLDGYSIDANHDIAPTLYAFARLQHVVHPAAAAGVFAIAGTILVLFGVVDRRLALVGAFATSLALLVAASSWSAILTKEGRDKYLPADAGWVDHADHGTATMLVVGKAWNGQALGTLFWNPSVSRVVRMPHAAKVDWLDDPRVHVDTSGTVHLSGKPLTGDVLVQPAPASAVVLRDARAVQSFDVQTLWRPLNAVRLAVVMNNHFPNNRVLHSGGVEVWSGKPEMAGWIVLRVGAPADLGTAHVFFGGRQVSVPAGQTRTVRVRACGSAPWKGGFVASPVGVANGGWSSPLLSVPRYLADPSACN
jgi:uncharacterized membrane protein YphA (DoxX/SURF4 family)